MHTEDIIIPVPHAKLPATIHWPSNPNRYTVIVSHGFRGSKDSGGRGGILANAFVQLGFTVVRFDFTPCQPISSQVLELQGIINWCRSTVKQSIILLGRSMGGSASLLTAAHDEQIKGLCLWAAPSDLVETFQLALGDMYNRLVQGESLRHQDEFGELILTPDFVRDFSKYNLSKAMNLLDQRGLPVLIIHGTNDAIVPFQQTRDFAYPSRNGKVIAIIEEGDHQFTKHYKQATQAVAQWLKDNFCSLA